MPLEERQKGHILQSEGDWNPLVRAVRQAAVPGEGGGGAISPLSGREEMQDVEQIPGRLLESFMAVVLKGRPTQYSLNRMVNPVHLPRRLGPPGPDGSPGQLVPIPAAELPEPTNECYWVQQVDIIGSQIGAGSLGPGYSGGGLVYKKRWNGGRIVIATNLAELTLDYRHLITRPRVYPDWTRFYNDRSPDEPNFVSSQQSAEPGCFTTLTNGQLVLVHKIDDVRASYQGPLAGGATQVGVDCNGEHFVFTCGLPQIRTLRITPFMPYPGWGQAAEGDESSDGAPQITFQDVADAFAQQFPIVVGYYGPANMAPVPEGLEEWYAGDQQGVPPAGLAEYEQWQSLLANTCGSSIVPLAGDEESEPLPGEAPPYEDTTPPTNPPVETESGTPPPDDGGGTQEPPPP